MVEAEARQDLGISFVAVVLGDYLVSGIPLPLYNLHGATLKSYTETVLYLKLNFKIFVYCGRVRVCVCVCVFNGSP